MKDTEEKINKLPDNAYQELKPGEEYKPVLPADRSPLEVTPFSIGLGLLMAVIFSAAAAYSGLKIGQVFEAAIPISIIAVSLSAALRKRGALGQNVIIQSIGASSGVVVAGAIFTIPGLFILQATHPEITVNFWQIFFATILGGCLGILFIIPFRKYFVKDMHGKLPFPQATATTEIIMTGESGGSQAKVLLMSGLIGGLFDFAFSAFRLFSNEITTRVIPAGEMLAEQAKMVFKFNFSALIFSFGYLIGLKFSLIMVMGSLFSWLVFIPLINEVGRMVAEMGGYGTLNPLAYMSAEQIWSDFIRPIGIGGIGMAGIIGIIKSSSAIGDAVKLAVGGGKKGGAAKNTERTQRDIKMSFVMLFLALTLLAVFVFLIIGASITWYQALVALLFIAVLSFLFSTVAANAIALVGSNPISGMTMMTLILVSVALVAVGLGGWQGMVSGLIIGAIVATALAMAGGFITDLKIGYWLGTTPAKQQSFKFLGTLVSAATVGAVIFILNEAHGFVYSPETPNPMAAPQANAMAAVIESSMTGNAQWLLLALGAIIAVVMNWLGISPLAFSLGLFLPIELTTPLIVGGLLCHWVNRNKEKAEEKEKKLIEKRHQRGILIASGFIAGGALFGVLGALIIFITGDNYFLNVGLWNVWDAGLWNDALGQYGQYRLDLTQRAPQIIALCAFIGLLGYFVWETMRAKKED